MEDTSGSNRIQGLAVTPAAADADDDKRAAERFPVHDLQIAIHRRGLRGIVSRPPRVNCVDFSLSGMLITADQPFKLGERVVIDIHFREFCLEEINGVVARLVDGDSDGRFGVQFCFESRFMRTPQIANCLRRIEGYLRQQQYLSRATTE